MIIGVVHLGASSASWGIAKASGEIIAFKTMHVPGHVRRHQTYSALLDVVAEGFREIPQMSEADVLVVTSPTPINWGSGQVGLSPGMPALQDRAFRRDIEIQVAKQFDVSPIVLVENDANAAGIHSKYSRKAENVNSFFHCRVSTGVGGCIFYNGLPFRGHRCLAGEIGHVTVQPYGLLCGCGNRGCVETVAGGAALLLQMRRLVDEKGYTHFSELISAWNSDDLDIGKELRQMGAYIGMVLASVVNILNTELVIVSGPMIDKRGELQRAIESEFVKRVCAGLDCPIVFEAPAATDHLSQGLSVWRFFEQNRSLV